MGMRIVSPSALLHTLLAFCILRPNGVTFVASPATSEFVKRETLSKGDIVSFKHRGFLLASKKPKLPSIYRRREDMQWDDVVQNWQQSSLKSATGTVKRNLI